MKNALKIMSNPRIFVFTIIWLMVLVFFGTIAQKDIGLFAAQNKYFSSIVIWIYGFLPLPGGLLTMTILFINLLAFILKMQWTKYKIGVIIIHLGALILLIGAAITNVFSEEGNMIIIENNESNYMQSFYYKEFTILNLDEYSDSIEVINFNEKILIPGNTLSYPNLPFKIEVIKYYLNSKIESRIYESDLNPLRGDAIKFELKERLPEKEINENISGILYKIISNDKKINGYYIYQLEQRTPEIITVNDQDYALLLRPKRTYLPFTIQLTDFEKIMHPGTEIAKSFSSEVYLIENETSRRIMIEMNAPLRYKGYTLYQASFAELDNGKQATVLAVVKNYGRLFPYIASIIMCIGVLLQMIIRLPKLFK